MAEERYRPGLLDLNLQISVVKNSHHLKYQLQMTKMLEEEYKDFDTTVCALRNLRGAVHFFLKDYESACLTFEEVLSKDDTNLNALRNLEIINRQLGYWSKADEYDKRINFDDPRLKATCFGEQGFAMLFDCHISSNEYERFKRSKKLFELCLEELEKTMIDHDDHLVLQWHLWYTQLLARLMNNCTKDHQKQERFFVWSEGIKHCLLVKQKLSGLDMSDVKNKHLFSVATTYIAIYCSKIGNKALKDEFLKRFSEETSEACDLEVDGKGDSKTTLTEEAKALLGEQIVTLENKIKTLPDKSNAVKEIIEFLKDPEKAFRSAVKSHPNGEVLCRYALFIKSKTDATLKELEHAEELTDKCMRGENGGNWFAFSIKSQILFSKCKQTYEKTSSLGQAVIKKIEIKTIEDENQGLKVDDEDVTTNEESQSTETGKIWYTTLEKWLKDSVKYGKKAGEINASTEIYSALGEAYHWLALNQKDQANRDKYFFKSLANFLYALQHAEGNKRPFVHISHGECLFDMKQYLPALESFKRAIECGTKKMEYVYKKLFECYIKLQNERADVKDQMYADLAYWIRMGKGKFKNPEYWDKGKGKNPEYWLDSIMMELKEQVQNDPVADAEIEKVFANAARELNDRESFPVSDTYLQGNATFALCLFGETLQLRNKSYSENCIKMLDKQSMSQVNEDQSKKNTCVQNVAEAFKAYKKNCLKSSAKQYLREELFLIQSFKQLHEKWKAFAELVAEEIKSRIPLLGCFLLSHVGMLSKETPIPESPVTEMSMRELSFCVKQLDPTVEMHQQKFKDCFEAFDKYIEKLTGEEESETKVGYSSLSEPKVRKKQYDFDFSVIYSESDSQWVEHSLLPTLERKYGFRGYVENRDLLPGQSRFNIFEAFEKCYKVIVILTDKFCEDKWNYFVFQQAMYGRMGEQSVIPIQRSGLKEMPKELSTVISLIAVQNLDWERLVKELE